MDAILGSVGLPDRSPEGKVTDFLTHSSLPRETILFHPPRPRSTAARGQGGGWRDDQRWAQSSPYPWLTPHRGLGQRGFSSCSAAFPLSSTPS